MVEEEEEGWREALRGSEGMRGSERGRYGREQRGTVEYRLIHHGLKGEGQMGSEGDRVKRRRERWKRMAVWERRGTGGDRRIHRE